MPNCCSYNKEYVWPINVSKEFLRSLGAVIHLEKKKVVLRSYRRPQSLTSSLLYSPRSPRLQAFPVVCSQLQHHVAGGWQWASVRRGPWGRIRSQCLWHLSQLCSHCEFVCLFSILLHVVCLSCHILTSATASFAFNIAGTFWGNNISVWGKNIPLSLVLVLYVCVCVCVYLYYF